MALQASTRLATLSIYLKPCLRIARAHTHTHAHTHIHTHLQQESERQPSGSGPLAEIEFWRLRNAILSALYEQLNLPSVRVWICSVLVGAWQAWLPLCPCVLRASFVLLLLAFFVSFVLPMWVHGKHGFICAPLFCFLCVLCASCVEARQAWLPADYMSL
eukprot:1158274-Pelagomonas_calceolata.AAC.10